MLMMRLVAAEDPGLPIGEITTYVNGNEIVTMDPNYKGDHQGEFPPVPLWLKMVNVIAMPVVYILPEDGFKALSDHANGFVCFLAIFVSSVFWGFLIVFTNAPSATATLAVLCLENSARHTIYMSGPTTVQPFSAGKWPRREAGSRQKCQRRQWRHIPGA